MENNHRKALQKTRTTLVRDLDPSGDLQDLLVSEGIFTPLMSEDIQAERSRADKVRRLLDNLIRRGPKAYAIFLKCLRNSGHEHLANAVEDNEYQLRGLPVPPRAVECQEREGQSTSTVYTRQHGQVTLPEHTMGDIEVQAPQGLYTQTQGYPTEQFQPSQENNPYGSLLAPSGTSINQGLANQMAGNSHVTLGQAASGQRNEDMMEVADSQPALAQPPSASGMYSQSQPALAQPLSASEPAQPAPPAQSAYQRVALERKYKMESDPRGLCLIINNKNYRTMSCRTGTDVDRDQLRDLFQQLNFWVDIKNDLPGMEMKRQLEKLTRFDGLPRVDSLVICFLCHGDSGKVYGTDGVALNLLNDAFKIFGPQSCPALIGKPKLFVLNSCRGGALDVGNHFNTIGNHLTRGNSETDLRHHLPRNVPDVQPTTPLALPETNPSFKDLYIAYSTFPGHVSYRNTQEGSWFVQKLVEVFREEASAHDIDIMMREVNRRVANMYDVNSLAVQMPAPSNTLTRQWYFNPV
ncbi:caspase-9-like isoform X2 [Mizuhopecten yessoensis]|uniref:caspase-9-like isoform X2 n=1 Tax=Mizuhopecten yessoensis TaxID=6573 RepID=UPI000B45E2BD|nr:caspase-9-like isoform X2 [Mizuhopecten yessoensis]